MFVPILLVAAAYSLMTYGRILVKGYDITFTQWVNPLTPYQWPADGGDPPVVPEGQVFPSG